MEQKMLYLECFSGISGDMSVAAMLDLGADENVLRAALESLNVSGYEIEIKRVKKCGIDSCSFDVLLEDFEEHHHHEHHHDEHSHEHHNHNEHHEHTHHHHKHEHRNIESIETIILNSDMTQKAKDLALKIFGFVARAEAKAHGLPINEVHFHEVGAIDSIVDIVALAVCIDNLGIEDVVISTIYEGQGFVKCQHGVIPVPVPAVTNIAKEAKMPIRITENRGEMITPTGMAIAAALKTRETLPENYIIEKIGIGAGKKEFKNANILRAMIINSKVSENQVTLIDTNIDDCTPEIIAYTFDKLLENGAKDVFCTPIYMKKNRPATKLSVICDKDQEEKMENIIFSNLTTIGVRKTICDRVMLNRKMQKINTSFGEITFKVCQYNDKTYAYPEYEEVKKLCDEQNLDFDMTYCKIKAEGN